MSALDTTEAVLTVSPAALAKIIDLRANETDADQLGLRIEITGSRGVDFTYDLAFEVLGSADDGDVTFDAGGIVVVVPAGDVEHLRGAELDLPSNPGQQGLVLRNPNRPELAPGDDLELVGSVEDRVRQLLEQRINPAIAAHGGFAELVGVRGDRALIRLGGGCQGCAMSRMTVAAGIEAAIQEHIPELVGVEDVTDHESGETPYYSS